MPRITRTKERKRIEQQLHDCNMQIIRLNISKIEIVRRVSFRDLGIEGLRKLTTKQKFDRVNAALLKNSFVNLLFAKRVVEASKEVIAEAIVNADVVKKEEEDFLLGPISFH